jgi:spore germination cell wall hydrolase CwlJ-like protein
MSLSRKLLAASVTAGLMSTGIALVAAHAEVADTNVPALTVTQPVQPVLEAPAAAAPVQAAPASTPIPSSEGTPAAERATAPRQSASASSSASSDNSAPDRELTCLAKVVVHEAGNQSRAGQLAVAQVVMNRVRSPRFPNTICGVVMQRGQFFNVHAYNPPRDARWRRALEVARDAREGVSAPVVGGAFFFHAAYAPAFRGRTRVARLGDHVFYR